MSHATLCFLSYERPNFLAIAIETAIANAGEKVEVIVHDDGSANPELLKYLYTIHQKGIVSSLILNAPGVNQGQGVALNRMFRMSTGDPIFKLDHDLIFKPGWLATCRRILEDERVGLLGLFKYLHEPVDWRTTGIEVEGPPPSGYGFHTHICGSGFAVPRKVWNRLRPFEERWDSFGEDWDFQKRVHARKGIWNALPDEDLVDNQGFGLGPSTVVVQETSGKLAPRGIHKLPMLVGG